MYIRCTTIKSKKDGEPYKTYRLVETQRIAGKVKQFTLLNLGRNFSVNKESWSELSTRISEILSGQRSLFETKLDYELETLAQNYAAQILIKQKQPQLENSNKEHGKASQNSNSQFESVNIDSIELLRARSIGVEQLSIEAIEHKTNRKVEALLRLNE